MSKSIIFHVAKCFAAPLLITSFLVTSSLHSQIPNYVPTNGLVGYWPFNGNANDESGNGNHGTVNGATLTSDRNGNANSAYSFDGVGNFIQVPNSNSLQNINSITISAWININELYYVAGTGYFPIINKSDNPSIYGQYALGIWSPNSIGTTLNSEQSTAPFSINFGSWRHVVAVINSSGSAFYSNGNLLWEGSTFSQPNSILSNMPLYIGTDRPGAIEFANGLIDDIAIYNRALTPLEITALYSGTNNNGGNGNNTSSATSTVPAGISYQAVARNAQGTALANTAVQVKFSLITDSLSGTIEYVETHALNTNALGLFTTAFGTGTAVTGTWAGINWTHSNKYLKVELDAGNGFVDVGTQQLLSSPFAIRAQSAATIENGALPVYSNNAAAIAGGLTVGKLYRTTTGVLMVVY